MSSKGLYKNSESSSTLCCNPRTPYLLGYTLGYDIRVELQNIEVVKNWLRLGSVTKIRIFMGLTSYYRHNVKNCASIATHLTNLTKKEVLFEWTNKCDESFLWL